MQRHRTIKKATKTGRQVALVTIAEYPRPHMGKDRFSPDGRYHICIGYDESLIPNVRCFITPLSAV